MKDSLSTAADVAAIATAVVAGWAYLAYRYRRSQKRKRLEAYLLEQTQGAIGDDSGMRSVTHLMARVGMTEAEILDAAFDSSYITRHVARDPDTGHAVALMFKYGGALWPPKPLPAMKRRS